MHKAKSWSDSQLKNIYKLIKGGKVHQARRKFISMIGKKEERITQQYFEANKQIKKIIDSYDNLQKYLRVSSPKEELVSSAYIKTFEDIIDAAGNNSLLQDFKKASTRG